MLKEMQKNWNKNNLRIKKIIKRKGYGVMSKVNIFWLIVVFVNVLLCCNFYRIKKLNKYEVCIF